MKSITLAVIAAFVLSTGEAPHVELDFNHMGSGDWRGKRFSKIIPDIKRIVRFQERGFTLAAKLAYQQADAGGANRCHLPEVHFGDMAARTSIRTAGDRVCCGCSGRSRDLATNRS